MDITGTIKVIGEAMQVSEKFKKRDVVLTDNSSQYPQHILFQLTQDKCGLIDGYKVGDEIKAHFNLRGKEFIKDGKTSYFNNLEIWRIEGEAKASEQSATSEQAEDDNLPF